jgi:ubiquinone/menaquinone biosynthesis C-methylase UbiE
MPAPSLNFDTPDLATHYERVSADRQFKAGQVLLSELKLRAGEHALDVGCGTGLLADHAAGLVGPSGSVLGFDPLPLRIELARKRARPNVSYFVGDALDLAALESARFDVVYLNAVFHWLPDKPLALRNLFRVLKPGGRIGITTGSKEHTASLQEIRERVLALPPFDRYPETAAGVSQKVSASELDQLLRGAGFAPELVEVRPDVSYQRTAEAAIDFSQASSFGNFLGHLPEKLRGTARKEIARQLELTRTEQGIPQQRARIFAVAQKPRS